MTAETRLAALLKTEFVPTNTLVTIGMLRDGIGLSPQEYALVRGTLETAVATLKANADPIKKMQGIDLADALQGMLGGKGISFSEQSRRDMIDLLAAFGRWPDEVRDKIKSLGGVNRPRWQGLNYQAEPTIETVESEIAAEQIDVLRGDLREQFDAIINQVGTDEQDAAVDSLRAIADKLEA